MSVFGADGRTFRDANNNSWRTRTIGNDGPGSAAHPDRLQELAGRAFLAVVKSAWPAPILMRVWCEFLGIYANLVASHHRVRALLVGIVCDWAGDVQPAGEEIPVREDRHVRIERRPQ
jgi:hypothetical protein